MSPCDSCHAGCCRSFAVPISGADVIRIENGLGLDFWDFACRWADPQGTIARNYAPQFRFSDEPETPFVLCLMHEKSKFLEGTTKCRFLMESAPDEDHPLGVARCGIYHQRPGACRVFPTKLNDTNDLAIIYDIPSPVRAAGDPVYDLCARQWEPSDLDPIQSLQDLVVAKYEMEFFHQLADVWNRNPRAWNIFPDFLRMVYAGRILRESSAENQDTEPTILPMPVTQPDISARRAA